LFLSGLLVWILFRIVCHEMLLKQRAWRRICRVYTGRWLQELLLQVVCRLLAPVGCFDTSC
jgi:hypothetical protein